MIAGSSKRFSAMSRNQNRLSRDSLRDTLSLEMKSAFV